MRVAIYARVSTFQQDTQMQLAELETHIANRNWNKSYIFQDVATGTTTDRPGFKRLISAVRSGEVDVVLIWKLDRMFRSLKDLVLTVNEFEERNVALVSTRDQIDLTTSTGRLMVHLLGAFSQFEADLIRARVISGIEKAKRQGKRLGRPRLNMEDDIQELRQRGYSYQKIQIKLGVSKGAVW